MFQRKYGGSVLLNTCRTPGINECSPAPSLVEEIVCITTGIGVAHHDPTKYCTLHDALHDLGLSAEVVRIVLFLLKGVAAAKHGVQHDASAPDVRQLGIIPR